jgi:hypothetical protein
MIEDNRKKTGSSAYATTLAVMELRSDEDGRQLGVQDAPMRTAIG